MISDRVIVLALLCVTLFPTSAAAECAWVLWFNNPQKGDNFLPMSGFGQDRGGEETCKRVAGEFLDENEKKQVKGAPRLNFFCLPETVDPRGAKGK